MLTISHMHKALKFFIALLAFTFIGCKDNKPILETDSIAERDSVRMDIEKNFPLAIISKTPICRLTEQITIDSVHVKEFYLTSTCLLINPSTFPEIKGVVDSNFCKRVNRVFSDNFKQHISNTAKLFGGCPSAETIKECRPEDLRNPDSAIGSFEIISLNDSLLSIVQLMFAFSGGGNFFRPSSYAITFNYKTSIVYSLSDFGVYPSQISHINEVIKKYFEKLFPMGPIGVVQLKNNKDYDSLKYAVRGDSLILVMEADPGGSPDYMTYYIPYKKLRR